MRYVDVSADARSRYSPRLILALSAALLAVAAGCEAPSETPAPQSAPVTVEPTAPVEEGCSEAFSRTLSPKRIDGGKHLYFESADLAFLLDPSVRLQSLDLALTLRGDRKKDKADPALALNGIEAYGADQFPFYKVNRYDPATDASQCEFKLHKLRLNGADPLDWMMAKILKNKGEVKISLHGKSVNILAASVTVTGRDVDQCGPAPSPTPTSTTPPPPVPVAPKTFISAVEPSASPASSTSIQFTLGSDQLGVSYECVLDNGAPSPCTSPQIYSNLANGSHSFSVKATNSAGLSDTVGAAYAWVIDSVAPSVELLNAAVLPSVSASSSIALVFAAVDASATTFSCSLDGGPAIACESPAAYTGLGEGAHSIAVSAVDAAGNVSSAPATFSWSIDQTAPEARITSVVPAEPVTRSVAATFSFSANESASFECSVDGGSFRECASPYALPDVLDGSHGFQVRAIDVAGNLGAVATYYWTVDTVAPVLSIGSVIPAAAITNSKSVSVEFSASEPASFECSLDGAAAAPCASPFSTLLFNEGNHEVAITAVDAAGNRSDTTRVAWIMDFTLPELSWGPMTPSAASVINSSALRAEILSLESVTLAGTLNLSDLGPISSPLQLSGLPEGAYSLAVIGTDRAGNSSSPLVHEFSVDLTAPVVTLSALHAGGALTTEAINSFEFSANETASFECSLDSAGFSACSSPLNVSGLSDGLHVFEVRATDVAGNVSALASASWQVDRLAPVTTLVPTRTQNASISFAFTVTEPIARFECSLDGQTFAECTPPVAYFGLSVGNHSFAVRAVDLAGNLETPPATYSWIVDPPITTKILSITPAEKYTRSSSISFTFSSNQSGGATFICSRDGEAAGPCVSPVSYTGLASGSHSFVVRAVDSWGSPDPIGASYSWSVDTTPPVVVSFTPTGGSYSVTVNWTTDEPATSKINWGLGSDTSRVVNEDSNYVTSHSVRITGLSASTLYSFIVSGHDRAGNAYVSAKKQVRTY